MAQGIFVEGSPAGWMYDSSTKQTRWWDGKGWTDFTPPPAPVSASEHRGYAPAIAVHHAAEEVTSRNGAAKASLVFLVLALLGAAAVLWLITEPGPRLLVGGVVALTLVAAFVLGVIGLVAAIRRPTKKSESIFALVASALLLIGLMAAAATSLNQMALSSL